MTDTLPHARANHVAPGYLRSFVTVLVVAHHAALAYLPDAPPPPRSLVGPGWWRAFPIVDPDSWSGARWLVGWNDTFFMALMFLLSGLFVWPSLRAKGPARFVRDRLVRLGLPAAFATVVLAPIAYYPTFLQTGGHGLAAFWQQWRALDGWPTGPAWFLGVLLAFDVAAAALFALARGRDVTRAPRSGLALAGVLVACSAIAYLPLTVVFDTDQWTAFGPIAFQTTRIAHYAVYFAIGGTLGAAGIERSVIAAGGPLARRWWAWLAVAVSAFAAVVAIDRHANALDASQSSAWGLATSVGLVVTCAASSIALLALATRFANHRNAVADSLGKNAYGIYLVHYAFVTWAQYALLGAPLPGAVKCVTVTVAALAASWATVGVQLGARRQVWLRPKIDSPT